MKNLSIILITALAFSALAFKVVTNNGAATAIQQEGIYLFMYSTPTTPYDYLGTVKGAGMTWGGTQEETMKSIFKRVKKAHPDVQGIIFHADNSEKVDAIKFK